MPVFSIIGIAVAGLIVLLLVVAVLLAFSRRWRALGAGLAVVLVLGAVGFLLMARLAATRQVATQHMIALRAQTDALVESQLRTQGVQIINAELPESHAVDAELLAIAELPVQILGRELVVGGRAAVRTPPAEWSSGGARTPAAARQAAELALENAVEREIAEKLDDYFERLVSGSEAPPQRALRSLRATLSRLPDQERRLVAAQLARQQIGTIHQQTVHTADADGAALDHAVFELAFLPEQVEQLAGTKSGSLARFGRSTWGNVLLLVGTLVVASLILKASARRSAAAPHA